MIKLSASSLKDYKSCNYKMYLRKQDYVYVDTVPLLTGRIVHDTIEMYESGEYSSEEDTIASAGLKINNALASTTVKFTQWDSVAKIHDNVRKMLKNYFKYKEGEVKKVEWSFEVELESVDGIPYAVIGRIDQLVEIDGVINVIDLKTSRKPPTEFEILGDYQFTMYALAFYHEYGYLPDYVCNFYLTKGVYIVYPRDNDDIAEFKQLLDQTVYELTEIKENWRDYHKSKGYQCNFCNYANACYGIKC